MLLKEALDFLKNKGFVCEDTDTHDDEYQALKDEWYELLHKDLLTNKEMKRKWEVRKLLDELEDKHSNVEDKIDNAQFFNLEKDLPKYELELVEKLKKLNIKLVGKTEGSKTERPIYNFVYKYKGSVATMNTRLTIEHGTLMVEASLFSDTAYNQNNYDYDEVDLPGIYNYDTFLSVVSEERTKFKKKNSKKQYWIEVQFRDDDPAFDAINALKNFRKYNVQEKWNSYIDDVKFEMLGDGTVHVDGDNKKFLEYLIQFISETDEDRVSGTYRSWK